MRLSSLQKYILLEGLGQGNKRFPRDRLVKFYDQEHQQTKVKQRVKVVTRCLERMIDKELLIGYGVRTPHKWFIKEIKLTAKGRRVARDLLHNQQRLPFKKIQKVRLKKN